MDREQIRVLWDSMKLQLNSFYIKPPAMLGRTEVAVALPKATGSLDT